MNTVTVFLFVFGGAGFVVFLVMIIRKLTSPRKFLELEKLIESGNTKAAIRYAKSVLGRNDRSPEAHWYLGECYLAEDRADLAVVEFKYITNYGKYTGMVTEKKVRSRLAHTYLELGHLDESQKEFILLSKKDPANYENYYYIAKLFEDRNYSDSALTNYKKVIALNPQHSESYMRMGVLYMKKQQLSEAKKSFLMSLKYDPQNLACYFHLGKIAKTSGDVSTALSHFEKAQRDPDLRQRALLEISNIYISKGDRNRAIAELERAIKLGEENVPVVLALRHLLAQCREINKELILAVEQWEKIYAVNPKYKDVAEKLAVYSDLRADDKLKDFLTASQTVFQDLCTELVQSMGLAIQDVFIRNQDVVEVFALESQSKWRNAKKAPSIVKVFRSIDPISYDDIRVLYDQMRKINAMRSICITASKFSRAAIEFAQIRPIDLIDKEELTKMLKKI
jgi:tetratricopeptide (TPR) repeat protein